MTVYCGVCESVLSKEEVSNCCKGDVDEYLDYCICRECFNECATIKERDKEVNSE